VAEAAEVEEEVMEDAEVEDDAAEAGVVE